MGGNDGGSGNQNVFPNRMTLSNFKQQLLAARRGYSLLKKKSEILKRKFSDVSKLIYEKKIEMGQTFLKAHFAYLEVLYSTDNLSAQIQGSVRDARIKINTGIKNISGVQIPIFELSTVGTDAFELVGLGRGRQNVQNCKEEYIKTVNVLVELATHQTTFVILDEAIKSTDRRCNAIEYIIIPRIEGIVIFIESEIEESEREDFFRLKKIQEKKRDKMNEELEEQLKTQKTANHEYETVSALDCVKKDREYF